jgi:hypothetical protein
VEKLENAFFHFLQKQAKRTFSFFRSPSGSRSDPVRGGEIGKSAFILLQDKTPESVRTALKKMGYTLSFTERTSGPINAIKFDWKHGSLWGGSSNHGEDYGIAW